MIQRFGGACNFVNLWVANIEAARAKAPGSKRVLDTDMAIMKLLMATYEATKQANVEDLTDEEFSKFFEKSCARRFGMSLKRNREPRVATSHDLSAIESNVNGN